MNDGIQVEIERIERECGGEISLAARDLRTGWTAEYHANRKVKTASVIKLPILVHLALAVSEGRYDWNDALELTESEKVGGAGVLSGMTAGLRLSLHDLAYLMIAISDNTATNRLIERLGVAAVNERMRTFGLTETRLLRKSYSPDTPESAIYGMGVATPNEIPETAPFASQWSTWQSRRQRSGCGLPAPAADTRPYPALSSRGLAVSGKNRRRGRCPQRCRNRDRTGRRRLRVVAVRSKFAAWGLDGGQSRFNRPRPTRAKSGTIILI